MLDRAVPAPATDGRNGSSASGRSERPALERHRWHGRHPLASARRHPATRLADRLSHSDEVTVAVEAHVDPAHPVPELVEGGIQVEVDTGRDRVHKIGLGQHPGYVDEELRTASHLQRLAV